MALENITSNIVGRIKDKLPELAELLTKEYRDDLDAKISILDLSYNALLVNVYRGKKLKARELDAYNSIYDTLLQVVREACKTKTFTSLTDPRFLPLFNRKKSVGTILIDNGRDDIFLVGKNFEAVRTFVTKYISRNPKLKASRFGEKTIFEPVINAAGQKTGDYKRKTRSKVDIGHIPAADNENLISPLEAKIQSVLDYGIKEGNTKLQQAANLALQMLYKVQVDIAYNFKNTSPEAIQRAQSTLGKGYIVLTLHTENKNNQFAQLEAKIYNKLLTDIALSLNLHTVAGSNTIVEDIVQSIIAVFDKTKKPRIHKEQQGKVSTKLKSNVKTQGSKIKLPDVRHYRDTAPPVTNLSSLQSIINESLAERIRANMGTGNSRDVLNYRTGRLAESAKVHRMSESREGMITAFYTYMKNPYATFSAGGQQEFPKSRDPKLLISKSIREIAAKNAYNRMRAVLV